MALLERLKITRGADRAPILRLRSNKTKDPLDLTGVTAIQIVFNTRERGKLTLTNSVVPATRAIASKNNIIFSAQALGSSGNTIILEFNGVDNITAVVDAWNSVNPSNPAQHNATTGTEVMPACIVKLTGGYDAYQPVSIYGDARLGKILVILLDKDTEQLKTGENQGFKVIIDYGAHPGGTRHVGIYENKLDVKDI